MPGYYHYTKNRRPPRRNMNHPLNSVIWIIGLIVLFYTHAWWPGILILIGVNMVIGTLFSVGWGESYLAERDESCGNPEKEASPLWDWDAKPQSSSARPAPVQQTPAVQPPAKAEPQPYSGWLPARCPNCGAPVRPKDVKWVGAQASCEYCASALPLKQ